MDYQGLNYFGFSPPPFRIFGWGPIWLWHLFRRSMADGRAEAGVGLLNIRGRHLLYVGRSAVGNGDVKWCACVAFLWLPGIHLRAESEVDHE